VAALWLEARNTERRESRIWLQDKVGEEESKSKEKEVKFSHWQSELPAHENGDDHQSDEVGNGHGDDAEDPEGGHDDGDELETGEEHISTSKKTRKNTKSTSKAETTGQPKRELTEEADGGEETSKKKPRKAPTSTAGSNADGSVASRTRSGRKK